MDRYQKIKKIGEGSFGKAFLVKSKRDGQQYVIKEINIVRMSKKERDEARKEVALLAQMKHPNIVTYRESFEETGSLYICMDFCEAGDLYGKINSQRGILFHEDQVLDLFVQICFAIKYIHDRKILHRDIKSQNIFLTKNGTVKLGDFGIAKVLNSTVELARTCIGTPYYLSPEICENRPYNNKSDIWSLGCVLYEITTLKHAFEAGNMKNLVFKIVRGSYPPVSAKYSYELRNVIAALFKRNPRDRPSVNNLLKKNFLVKKVEKFMGNEVIAKELAHTVMHGQKMAKDVRALPPAPAPVSRPVSARSVQERRPESARPTPRYDPAAVYGAPVRKSKDNAARRSNSRDAPRKSSDVDRKRAAIAAVAASNNEIAKKRKELLEKEKARRLHQKENEFAVQHKAIVDKQKKSSGESRPKTPQQPVKRNIPSPAFRPLPVGGAPQRMPVNDRGKYDHYNEFLDKLAAERGDRQRDAAPKDYMNAGEGPQIAARQGHHDQQLGAKAAEQARVVEEYMNRKKEAAYYKQRGQAQVRGVQRRPDSARGGAGDARPVKREWAEIDAKNEEEKEYLARLKQIRLQNFNERRNMRQEGVAKQGAGVKGALNADAEQRKKKIEALKAQADERANKLKVQLEQKRREAYEKEKYARERDRGFEQKPLFPVEPPRKGEAAPAISITQAMSAIGAKPQVESSSEKVEPAPVIPITQAMAAIGARKEVESSIEKSPLQKKKDAILRRVNEKPRPKWGNRDEGLFLANMELEETASGMEATSVRDSVVLGGDSKPKEERKRWGAPEELKNKEEVDPDVLPSARRQWGGMHESLINKLSEADIQATVTLVKKEEESPGKPRVGETIVITTQPPTPKAHGTITLSKDDTKSKDEEIKDPDASKLAPGDGGFIKGAGVTIIISDREEGDQQRRPLPRPRTPSPQPEVPPVISDREEGDKPRRPQPRPRSRSPSPQPRVLPELKPRKEKVSGSDSDEEPKAAVKGKRSKSQLACLKAKSDKTSEGDLGDVSYGSEPKPEETDDVKPDVAVTADRSVKPVIAPEPDIAVNATLTSPSKPDVPTKPVVPTKPGVSVVQDVPPEPDMVSDEPGKPKLPAKPVIDARTVNFKVKKELEGEDEDRAEGIPDTEDSKAELVESEDAAPPAGKDENVLPREVWDLEQPSPSPEKPSSKLKESLKKESPGKVDVKGPTEVNASQGGKLFDKVELEEADDQNVDDMKVEEFEEEETNPSYQKTISGMKLGLTIGHFDLQNSKMLRTCSLPDLSKLFKTIEGSPDDVAHVRYSLDLPSSPKSQGDEDGNEDGDEEEGDKDREEEGSDSDSDVDSDEVDEDLANVMATMESLLLDRQDSQVEHDIEELNDLKGSGSDSGNEADNDRDSATTTGDSSIINTIVPGQEEWCNSDDDDDDNNSDREREEEDMFCRLEAARAKLESELGCDRFLDVYKAVQAAHEDEDETIENGEKIALKILGDKGHLYNKILQLVMADGAYIEDND
ncbi:serine/threonine-protein kinase Nek1-like isoform X2 [Lineus longissimus]|uniref:serine/threonine-protein kinase Nek1-like isoform X2 n=1 Tax=Lineus longissimus TaxID=88925 RepID=UPI00315D302D